MGKFGAYLGKKIGSGNKGDIYILEGLSSNKIRYLVKMIRYVDPNSKSIQVLPKSMRNKFSFENQRKEVQNEINIQIMASKLGIAPKILSYTDEYIIMEYIDGITLQEYFSRFGIDDKIIKIINKTIAKMHNAKIKHNDLIDLNIMIDKYGKIYIIDFGMSEYDPKFTNEELDDDYLM